MKKQSPKKAKVLLAMSGGVDSTVAALLLKKQGYEIIGAFMKNWSDTKNDFGECTWKDDRKVAMTVAAKLEIPLITLDFEKQYRKQVVDEMYKAYSLGLTPNPDVDCNNKVKFPLLWQAAKKLKCDFIATGHYARIKKTNGKWQMLRARDESKDQSYFLYRLNHVDLSHTLFPIGEYKKTFVREIAEKNKFANYGRKSTTGICFIGKVNLKTFLQKKIKPKKGKILNPEGDEIGQHDGIFYYTIGQRLGSRFGLEINKGNNPKRWYVASKDKRKNIIIAAPEGHPLLSKNEFSLNLTHWISAKPKSGLEIKVRIRQVGNLIPAKLFSKGNKWKVMLKKSTTGISEGQSAVIYLGSQCLGGGIIKF